MINIASKACSKTQVGNQCEFIRNSTFFCVQDDWFRMGRLWKRASRRCKKSYQQKYHHVAKTNSKIIPNSWKIDRRRYWLAFWILLLSGNERKRIPNLTLFVLFLLFGDFWVQRIRFGPRDPDGRMRLVFQIFPVREWPPGTLGLPRFGICCVNFEKKNDL